MIGAGVAKHAARAVFFALSSYGLFYFAYKYFTPDYGGTDFYHYYNIYLHPWDFHAGEAPFVYRQLNATLVNAVWKLGLYRPEHISFSAPGYDPSLFFAAVLVNWVALVACATTVAAATAELAPESGESWPLVGGGLVFFGFFAQQGVLAGLSEGVSWLLIAVGILGWTKRSFAVLALVLGLSIVQRETIPIVFGAFSAAMLLMRPGERRFHLAVLAASLAAFALYVALRLKWAPASGYAEQLEPGSFIRLLGKWRRLASADNLFQIVLTQNLLIGLGLVSGWARLVGKPLGASTAALFATVLALAVVGVGTLIQSHNIGRILAVLTPIEAALLASGLAALLPHPSRPFHAIRPPAMGSEGGERAART
jgi:hypothetical protein